MQLYSGSFQNLRLAHMLLLQDLRLARIVLQDLCWGNTGSFQDLRLVHMLLQDLRLVRMFLQDLSLARMLQDLRWVHSTESLLDLHWALRSTAMPITKDEIFKKYQCHSPPMQLVI